MPIVVRNPPVEISALLQKHHADQLPFAIAKTMTESVKAAQSEMIAQAHRVFKVRTSWANQRSKYGFRVKTASKRNLRASVYSNAPFLEGHEGADTRTPAGQHFAIPQAGVRRTARGLVRKDQRPQRLQGRLFRRGDALYMENRRTGKVKYMYALARKAKLPKPLDFYGTTRRAYTETFRRRFAANFDNAVLSRRK